MLATILWRVKVRCENKRNWGLSPPLPQTFCPRRCTCNDGVPVIRGMESTVAVTSRAMYSTASAGASDDVWPTIQHPASVTAARTSSVLIITVKPGMDSSLSNVPPVWPSPRPDTIGTCDEKFSFHSMMNKKGSPKGFPCSLASVWPAADPGVQAVRPQVTITHPPGGRLLLLSARPAVTFPAAEHHRPLAVTKLCCLVTEAHRCEQLAHLRSYAPSTI